MWLYKQLLYIHISKKSLLDLFSSPITSSKRDKQAYTTRNKLQNVYLKSQACISDSVATSFSTSYLTSNDFIRSSGDRRIVEETLFSLTFHIFLIRITKIKQHEITSQKMNVGKNGYDFRIQHKNLI